MLGLNTEVLSIHNQRLSRRDSLTGFTVHSLTHLHPKSYIVLRFLSQIHFHSTHAKMASPANATGGAGMETSSVSAESSSSVATLFGHPAPSSDTATHASTSLTQKTSLSVMPQKRKLGVSKSETPKRNYHSKFTSVMCEIYVGTGHEKTIFPVHKEVFAQASKYFKAAFDGGFLEGGNGILQLPEEDPELFGEIVRLVYRGSVGALDRDIFYSTRCRVKLVSGLPLIFPLYVAFEKYQLNGLLDDIHRNWNQFVHSLEWKDVPWEEFLPDFSPDVVTWVYENSLEKSRARQYAVEMIRHHLFHGNSVEEDWQECFIKTPEIAVDLTRHLMKFVLKVRWPDDDDTDSEY